MGVPHAREELVEALSRALRAAFAQLSTVHAAETAYAFGLDVVSEDGWIVGAVLATEEGTLARAGQYAELLCGEPSAVAVAIRWWDADWPCDETRALFAPVNALLAERARAADVASREEAYLSALESVRAEIPSGVVLGAFGVDPERKSRTVPRLNARAAVDRWRAELDAGEHAYTALQR